MRFGARVSHGLLAGMIAALLLGGGCKKDDPQNEIKGRVSVSGGEAAGVTVEVYDMPNMSNNALWSRTAATAGIGFPYNVSIGFDWRLSLQSRRSQVQTDGSGSFSIPDLSDGNYLVIARKNHYGWSDPIPASLGGQELDIGVITLFPEDTLPRGTYLSENTQWLANHHYVIETDVYIDNAAVLTIEPGAVVRVGDGGRIIVLGGLSAEGAPDAYIRFTSDNQINPTNLDWRRIDFDEGAGRPVFRYCAFSYCESGIASAAGGGIVEHCYFANIGGYAMDLTGAGANAGDSVLLRRNVIDHLPYGMRVVQVNETGMVIERNAIFNCSSFGIELGSVYGGSIYCNWFYNCGRNDTLPGPVTGVTSLMYMRRVEIYRNMFESSWYALALGSRVDSSVHIHNNRFYRMNRVMNVGVTNDGTGPSYPTFYSNCLENCADFFIFMGSCHVNYVPINAAGNYWGTQSSTTIEDRFNDCQRDPTCPCIIYQPFLTECPASEVGICED